MIQVQNQNQVFTPGTGGGTSGPVAPSTPTNVHINATDASTPGAIIVEWDQLGTPDFSEIWKSSNGGAFVLFDSVVGGTTSYTDFTGITGGEFWTYKIRAVQGALSSSFSGTASVSAQLANDPGPGVTSVTYPDLDLNFATLSIAPTFGGAPNLLTVSFPRLKRSGAVVIRFIPLLQ